MKKFLIMLLVFSFSLAANAGSIEYKNIKPKSKLKISDSRWMTSVAKKDGQYYTKVVSETDGGISDFYDSDGTYAFTTGCEYEFIHNGNLTGYSNKDLKFYDFSLENGVLDKRELSAEEVRELFPHRKIIKISEFNPYTNSIKMKKSMRDLKLILLNDMDGNFDGFGYSTGNSKIETYPLAGFIDIKTKGMVQFSAQIGEDSGRPFYVILVR